MNKKNLFLFLAMAAIGLLPSCKDEPDTPDPDPPIEEVKEITFKVNHEINGELVTWFDKNYSLPAGNLVNFTRLAYILSDFYLVGTGGDTVRLEDQYALMDGRMGPWKVTLTDVPMGSFTHIGFSMGLVPEVNHADPNQYPITHPLSSVMNALHWSWTEGYIFIAIEGRLAADNEPFIYHIAGDHNRVDYSLPIAFEKKKPALTAQAVCKVENIFQNPVTYNMETDGMATHTTTDAVTTTLVANMHDLFTIQSVE